MYVCMFLLQEIRCAERVTLSVGIPLRNKAEKIVTNFISGSWYSA